MRRVDMSPHNPMAGRVVRFREIPAHGNALTFIDSAISGHRRLNVALVGDTAAENPELKPLISGPHTFQVGMFLCLPGEGPAWHLHQYVEAFIPLSGSWRFLYATSEHRLPEADGEYVLDPWDMISLPAGIWRSFSNVSQMPAWCLGVLDEHPQFAYKDPQWPKAIVDQAASAGLEADERGRLAGGPEVARLEQELKSMLLEAADRAGGPSVPSAGRPLDGAPPSSSEKGRRS